MVEAEVETLSTIAAVVEEPLRSCSRRVVVEWKKEVVREGWEAYLIIVTDATDGVSVNFFGWCKFLQI